MKKINKLSLVCSLPIATIAVGLPALVACSTTTTSPTTIDPQLKYGTHVQKVVHTPITLNNEFTIKVKEFDKGWQQIDKDKTIVKIGGKAVDYTLKAHDEIVVAAKDVTSSDIYIEVESKMTVSKMQIKWVKEPYSWQQKFPVYFTNETIRKSDFQVLQLWGNEQDGVLKVAEPTGDENGYTIVKSTPYIIEQKWVDITPQMKEGGYTLTAENDMKWNSSGKPLVTEMNLRFVYYSETFTFDQYLTSYCGNRPTTIDLDEDSKVEGLKLPLNSWYLYGSEVDPGAYPNAKMIVEENTSDAVLTGWALQTYTKPGILKFHIQSLVDETVISPSYTITIGE